MDKVLYEAVIKYKITILNFYYMLIIGHKYVYEDAADIIDRMSELQREITELQIKIKSHAERNNESD